MITINQGKNITASVGVTDERFDQMKKELQNRVNKMISDGMKDFIENPSKEKGFSTHDVLKCCDGLAKTEGETFMLGLLFTNMVDNLNQLQKEMQG